MDLSTPPPLKKTMEDHALMQEFSSEGDSGQSDIKKSSDNVFSPHHISEEVHYLPGGWGGPTSFIGGGGGGGGVCVRLIILYRNPYNL